MKKIIHKYYTYNSDGIKEYLGFGIIGKTNKLLAYPTDSDMQVINEYELNNMSYLGYIVKDTLLTSQDAKYFLDNSLKYFINGKTLYKYLKTNKDLYNTLIQESKLGISSDDERYLFSFENEVFHLVSDSYGYVWWIYDIPLYIQINNNKLKVTDERDKTYWLFSVRKNSYAELIEGNKKHELYQGILSILHDRYESFMVNYNQLNKLRENKDRLLPILEQIQDSNIPKFKFIKQIKDFL